jgi:hypothetical protein
MAGILAKNAIPVLHSAVALLKLSQMGYSGVNALMMKTIINKKYSLPHKVIDALIRYFMTFLKDSRQMPLVWHQLLLTFVQRYKHELKPKQINAVKALTRAQPHHAVSVEIRRELNANMMGSSNSNPAHVTSGMNGSGAAAAMANLFALGQNDASAGSLFNLPQSFPTPSFTPINVSASVQNPFATSAAAAMES